MSLIMQNPNGWFTLFFADFCIQGDPKENAGDGKDGCESSDKSDDKVSMENFGEPVKQDAKDVHEINNGVSEVTIY